MNNSHSGTSPAAEPEPQRPSVEENIGSTDRDPGAAISVPEAPMTPEAMPPGTAPEPDSNPAVGQAGVPTSGAVSVLAPLALYSFLRLALVIGLTAVLMIFMPLIVALLFAIIVQLPLSWLLFAGPRRRVNEAIARTSHQRRTERSRLQSALRGDDTVD